MTYTYAVLQVSSEAYQEIKSKLEAAGYTDTLHETSAHGPVIDMHGLALGEDRRRSAGGCSESRNSGEAMSTTNDENSVVAFRAAAEELEHERDTFYEFLRRWQAWATQTMRALSECDELTLPDDTRTREVVSKALGELVELQTLMREVRSHLFVPEPWPGGPPLRDLVIDHLDELIQKEVQGRCDAHELAAAELKADEQVREFTKLILHGSDEHRRWLVQAAERFIAGERTDMGALLHDKERT